MTTARRNAPVSAMDFDSERSNKPVTLGIGLLAAWSYDKDNDLIRAADDGDPVLIIPGSRQDADDRNHGTGTAFKIGVLAAFAPDMRDALWELRHRTLDEDWWEAHPDMRVDVDRILGGLEPDDGR